MQCSNNLQGNVGFLYWVHATQWYFALRCSIQNFCNGMQCFIPLSIIPGTFKSKLALLACKRTFQTLKSDWCGEIANLIYILNYFYPYFLSLSASPIVGLSLSRLIIAHMTYLTMKVVNLPSNSCTESNRSTCKPSNEVMYCLWLKAIFLPFSSHLRTA